MKTIYLSDSVVLGECRILCRHCMIFITEPAGHSWHALLYDPQPGDLEACGPGRPLSFEATTADEVVLQGKAFLNDGDAGASVCVLQGLGALCVRGEASALQDSASWTAKALARRAS